MEAAMPKYRQTSTQNQNQNNKRKLTQGYIQLKNLIFSHNQEIIQTTYQKLSQNPALVLEGEPDFPEDMDHENDESDEWNQDFDKPHDEYETGEPAVGSLEFEENDSDTASWLERAAFDHTANEPLKSSALNCIDHYRVNGALPAETDKKLKTDLCILESSISIKKLMQDEPTFEVYEDSDGIHAALLPTITDSLTYIEGYGGFSEKAKKYVNQINKRAISLNNLASTLLVNIQGDFFRQLNYENSLLALVPVSKNNLIDLNIDFHLKINTKILSRLYDLSVICTFGKFPLGFFMPSKAALVKLWVKHVVPKEISNIEQIIHWIKDKIDEKIKNYRPDDPRLDLIKPILDINTNDIKNARRKQRTKLK
jgi:hypothetical protein